MVEAASGEDEAALVLEDLDFLDFLGEGFADGEGCSLGGSEGESSELMSIATGELLQASSNQLGKEVAVRGVDGY